MPWDCGEISRQLPALNQPVRFLFALLGLCDPIVHPQGAFFMSDFEVRERRPRGWFWIDNQFMDKWAEKIGPNAILAYICICRHSDKDQKSYPSQERMASQCKIVRRSIIRAIKILEDCNIIEVETVREKGRFSRNIYHLNDICFWKEPVATTAPCNESYPHVYPQGKPCDSQSHGPVCQNEHPPCDCSDIHHVTHSHTKKLTTEKKLTTKEYTPATAGGGLTPPLSGKPLRKKRHTTEDFNALKDYQLKTWKLAAGEYPWSRADAGMLSRLLFYGLPKAMAVLDLFWVEIKGPQNKWVLDNVGRNAKGLLHMLPRLMDMAEVKIRAERHQRALLAAIPDADLKAGDELARTLGAGFQKVPRGPDHDAQRRAALDKADTLKVHHPEAA